MSNNKRFKCPNILETTLRDGSYVTNFAFTSADTEVISRGLEEAGFKYIEVGHGVGLGASEAGYGKAAETDEGYLVAARRSLRKASFGMFCIPGIAELKHVDLAHRYGMGFIRIGTNVTEVSKSEEFIKRAKKYGMFIAANYMKSYALPPEDFAKQVQLSTKYGADMIYIVDSAGGMFPDDLLRYFRAARRATDLPIGFHGHDNLGLAVSNSIAAADMGIEFIDASLQGLGRSAGNACTETLVAALTKHGYDPGIDLFKLFELGQAHVQPLLTEKGKMPLDIVCGFAEFHSSYMPHIQKYAAKYRVDPAVLIIEMCRIDKVNLDVKVLDRVARRIKSRMRKKAGVTLSKYGFNRYVGGEQEKKSKN